MRGQFEAVCTERISFEHFRARVSEWPADRMIVNTLGLAQLRNGNAREAVKTLQRSLALDRDQYAGFDLYLLTICHAKLDEPAKAKDDFERAEKWLKEHGPKLKARFQTELEDFRAEAEEALKAAVAKEGN